MKGFIRILLAFQGNLLAIATSEMFLSHIEARYGYINFIPSVLFIAAVNLATGEIFLEMIL